MAAAIGCEQFYDFSEASEAWVSFEKEYIPNKENESVYKELKKNFILAYEAQLKLVDDNITTSMWKAPGL